MRVSTIALAAALVGFGGAANAVPISVLWWDSTPEYSGQSPDSDRQEMSDYLNAYDGGGFFSSTYVGGTTGRTPGNLASQLSSNSYDVIVLDETSTTSNAGVFNQADADALKAHYQAGKDELMLDGVLWIRSVTGFGALSDFPSPGLGSGPLLINQIAALGDQGGGIMIGNDHDCCHTDSNFILGQLLIGAQFSGFTSPSTDGAFNGDLLLNYETPAVANDILQHWANISSEGIAPTGTFTDFLGNSRELFSLVEVADFEGGPRFTYISSTIDPGEGQTDVDDETEGGTGGGGGTNGAIPLPAGILLLPAGIVALAGLRRSRKAA